MARVIATPEDIVSLELEDVQRAMPAAGPADHRHELERRHGQARDRARRQRMAAEHLCPAGRALDRAHLVGKLGEAWTAHRTVQLPRRFVAAGLVDAGYTPAFIAEALSETTARVRELLDAPLWWDPPDELLALVHPTYRHLVVGDRSAR